METTVKHQCPGALLPEGIPTKALNSLKKERQTTNLVFSVHCGRNLFYLRRKLLKPGLAAVPEVTQILPLLLTQEGAVALGAKTFFALGAQRVIFLTTEGGSFPSSPSD